MSFLDRFRAEGVDEFGSWYRERDGGVLVNMVMDAAGWVSYQLLRFSLDHTRFYKVEFDGVELSDDDDADLAVERVEDVLEVWENLSEKDFNGHDFALIQEVLRSCAADVRAALKPSGRTFAEYAAGRDASLSADGWAAVDFFEDWHRAEDAVYDTIDSEVDDEENRKDG